MKINIKKEYKSTVVGFNNSAKPLGERDDLHLLAEIAHKTQSKTLIKYFTKLPSLKSIQEYKGKLFLEKTAKVTPVEKQDKEVKDKETEENNLSDAED